jgi:hypothetical protein
MGKNTALYTLAGFVDQPVANLMDIFALAILLALANFALRTKDQKRRIALLGSHLRQYQVEKLMEQLADGYLRALGESDAERRTQVWNLLASTEDVLDEQFQAFAAGFAKEGESATRISKLPFPFADQVVPSASFDMRKLLAIHAHGIHRLAGVHDEMTAKSKAFMLSAEMFLMQHTCHWFCKSQAVASARLQMRHQTTYQQVLAAVSPETRQAYMAVVNRG